MRTHLLFMLGLAMLALAPTAKANNEVTLESEGLELKALLISGDRAVRGASIKQHIFKDDVLVADAEMVPYKFRGANQVHTFDLNTPPVKQLSDGIYRMELHLEGQFEEGGENFYKRYTMPLAVVDGTAYQDAMLERDPAQHAPFDVSQLPITDIPKLKRAANDPDVYTSYNCYYIQTFYWDYTYSGNDDGIGVVHGRIRWPSNTCNYADGPPANRRVLLFGHGADQDYMDHDYLMAHLAKNGFVTVSVQNTGSDQDIRARMMLSYLNALYKYWGYKDRLLDDVVFAGHSRGGEAAIRAARYVADNVVFLEEDYDTKGIIAIAPTDGGNNGLQTREVITGDISPAFLALYGSKDHDIIGKPTNPWPTAPERTVFATYDRAGSEISSEGIQIAGTHVRKAMAYVRKAHHKGWLDSDVCLDWVGSVTCPELQSMAKAYFNAFMRWNVYNQSSYRDYFDGSKTPDSLANVDFTMQFSDNPRRVIDNFEDGNGSLNSQGGSVYASSAIVAHGEDELQDMDPAAPHQTRGMRIKWNANLGTPYVRWYIPNNDNWFTGRIRDVTDYSHLSFRAGQNYNDAYNTEHEAQDFYVRIYSAAGWSSYLPVSNYGKLDYPHSYVTNLGGLVAHGDYANSDMETIRIPLRDFGNIDMGNVYYIYFYFNKSGYEAGSIHMDSLEFTE